MEVLFHRKFKKKFKRIPSKIQDQFLKRLDLFVQNKFDRTLNNHSVEGTFHDYRSINISGDYRALFQEHGDVVLFMTIGTHSALY